MKIPQHVINLIISQEWAIDAEYGLSQLNQFLFNMETGADFGKLREESRNILMFSGLNPIQAELTSEDIPQQTIANLSLTGVMRLEDGMCSTGVKTLVNRFYEAYANPNVGGILLDVNTGGGDPQAAAELNAAIRDRNKPVVSRYIIAASGGVLGTLASDEIIAASLFAQMGSVGAYVSINKEFIKEYNELILDIYSDLSPDKNADFRELTEGESGDPIKTEKIKQSVNVLAKNFQDEVTKFRRLRGDDATIQKTLMGGMFGATEAIERGLADSIGTKKYALQRVLSYIKN